MVNCSPIIPVLSRNLQTSQGELTFKWESHVDEGEEGWDFGGGNLKSSFLLFLFPVREKFNSKASAGRKVHISSDKNDEEIQILGSCKDDSFMICVVPNPPRCSSFKNEKYLFHILDGYQSHSNSGQLGISNEDRLTTRKTR